MENNAGPAHRSTNDNARSTLPPMPITRLPAPRRPDRSPTMAWQTSTQLSTARLDTALGARHLYRRLIQQKKQQPIRADVLVRRGPTDPAECTEVKVHHFCKSNGDLQRPGVDSWDNYLAEEEARIKQKYQPVRVRPWVFSTLGRPGEQFCFDIRRMARERLQRGDAQRVVSRESLRHVLLQRWRAELSVTLAIGVSNTLLETLEGTATTQLPCKPGAFYDLQHNSFTGY
jgi:hypothetical protein